MLENATNSSVPASPGMVREEPVSEPAREKVGKICRHDGLQCDYWLCTDEDSSKECLPGCMKQHRWEYDDN
jgi:hypothetical protein